MSKLKAFLIMLILVISIAVFTSCSEKIEGTWYLVGEDPDDVDNQLLLLEDGTFLIGEEPGTWTMTDGRLVLILPTDGGITLDESEYEGEKSYINLEDNDIQFIKQYDKAKEVYDEIVAAEEEQRRLEEEQAQKEKEEKIQFIVDNVPGRYDFADYDWMVSEDDIIYVRLNDDGTYFISCDSYDGGLTEEGTYTIDTGDLNTTYSGKEFLTIQFTSEKESPNLAEYKKGDYEDGEPSMKDVEACITYDDSGERTVTLEVGNGLGFSTGAYYIPAGTYSKTE